MIVDAGDALARTVSDRTVAERIVGIVPRLIALRHGGQEIGSIEGVVRGGRAGALCRQAAATVPGQRRGHAVGGDTAGTIAAIEIQRRAETSAFPEQIVLNIVAERTATPRTGLRSPAGRAGRRSSRPSGLH